MRAESRHFSLFYCDFFENDEQVFAFAIDLCATKEIFAGRK